MKKIYIIVSHINLYEIVSYSSYIVGLEVDWMKMGDSLVPDVSGSLANLYPSRCIAQTGYHMTPVLDDDAIASYLSRIN